MGWLLAFEVSAISDQDLLMMLSSRIHPLNLERGSLIKSFSDKEQSYVYDQALAIISFTQANEKDKARKLLKAFKSLQLSDGSLYFSYYLDGTSPYPAEGDKRIAGALSWVALAAIQYQKKFKSEEFLDFNKRLLTYLSGEIFPIEVKGKKASALRFAPHDFPDTAFRENDTAALEHNLDAYAAFYHFSKINHHSEWKNTVNGLRDFILSMWDQNKSHFWSGANFSSSAINKSEYYLDNQSWSVLALDERTLGEISAFKALEMNCEIFLVKRSDLHGFYDSRPVRAPAETTFVWSEGTLGQAMAMKRMNQLSRKKVSCGELTSADFLEAVKRMQKEDGGIAYSTKTSNKDFTESSSVAGTAWLYFAIKDFNPFGADEYH
jgi:hypothetical protein